MEAERRTDARIEGIRLASLLLDVSRGGARGFGAHPQICFMVEHAASRRLTAQADRPIALDQFPVQNREEVR